MILLSTVLSTVWGIRLAIDDITSRGLDSRHLVTSCMRVLEKCFLPQIGRTKEQSNRWGNGWGFFSGVFLWGLQGRKLTVSRKPLIVQSIQAPTRRFGIGWSSKSRQNFGNCKLENHSNSILILRFCEERLVRYINLPTDLPKRRSDLELDVTAYINRQIVTPVPGDVLLGKRFEEGEAGLYK